MDTDDRFLIEPEALATQPAAGTIIIDARREGEFGSGHIQGAVPFSTYDQFVPDTTLEGMRAFAEAMSYRFSTAGVTLERPVVIYDEDTGMRAARELWILEFLGHRNVRMLHGGLRQWDAEGWPLIEGNDVPTVRIKKSQISIATGSLASADEISRRAGNENFWLLDVRDDEEWAGKDQTPCCARRGHIPHALHIEWTKFLEDGRFKSPEAIHALLAEHGVNPENDIVPYCHRGARSANTYYALRYARIGTARNFIGSWHEWSARSELPVE